MELFHRWRLCQASSCRMARVKAGLYLDEGLQVIHLFPRVTCKPDSQEMILAEKATQHRRLASPSKRETLLPSLNLTASKKQIAGKPPQRSKFGGIQGVPGVWTYSKPGWEGSEASVLEAPAQGTHFVQCFIRNSSVDFREEQKAFALGEVF